LLGGTIILFQTEAMWDMDSPNACAWNATLNASATGFSVIPIFLAVIVLCVAIGSLGTAKGFG